MCKVSEIGGGWTLMLKGALATYPILIAWGGWVTVGLVELKSFRAAGDRFTRTDANTMYMEIDRRLDNLPPTHVTNSIQDLERDVRDTKDMLQKFERDFTANFVRKDEL